MDERWIKNAHRNNENIARYNRAISLAVELNKRGELDKIEFDPIENHLVYHGMIITIGYGDFDRKGIQLLSELLSLFDELTMIGSSDGGIEFSLVIKGLYESGA